MRRLPNCRSLAVVVWIALFAIAVFASASAGQTSHSDRIKASSKRGAKTPTTAGQRSVKKRKINCRKRSKSRQVKKKRCSARKPLKKAKKPASIAPSPVLSIPLAAPIASSPIASVVGVLSGSEAPSTPTPPNGGTEPPEEPSLEEQLFAPVNVQAPAISGVPSQGETLSATPGVWEGSPSSYLYQWEDCNSHGSGCTDAADGESASYELGTNDVGHRVLVVVEATNTAGTTTASSASSGRISSMVSTPSAPTNKSVPTISGSTTVGAMLQATSGSWEGSPAASYAYQWQLCNAGGEACASIAGASNSTYRPLASQLEQTLRVVVTATNSGGSSSASSAASAAVQEAVSDPACTSTISSSLQSAIQSAAGGSVICLQAGDYGAMTISSQKSSMVRIRPVEGVSQSQAVLGYVDVKTSSNLTFEGLTIEGGSNGSSTTPATHIHWIEDAFTSGLCVQAPTSANIDVLVDSSTFINVDAGGCNNEGRLEVNGDNNEPSGTNGVVISNDLFEQASPSGCTDGVNITGGASGTQIGPGDQFSGLKQGSCAAHVDPIQFYGARSTVVTGDYFHGNSDGIMSPDGNGSPMTVTNSVFDTDGEYPDQIVIGGGEHDVISHDTFGHGARVRIGHVNVGATAANETVSDNVLTGGLELTEGQSSSGWVVEYDLVESEVLGSHGIKGKPTYVGGGSEPSTWAGWALTSGSLGYLTAGDGSSIGSNVF